MSIADGFALIAGRQSHDTFRQARQDSSRVFGNNDTRSISTVTNDMSRHTITRLSGFSRLVGPLASRALLSSARERASSRTLTTTPTRAAWPPASSTPLEPGQNYPSHVPLNSAQNALLAVGSGIVGVLNYTSRPDLIATLSESTASTFLPRLHDAMASHPEGRQILKDRPVVSSQTVNLDYLRGLRRGTVGREYVEWLDRDGITPDSREKVCSASELLVASKLAAF
jgi:hypothetical protein